jgi:hypothetical protein
MVSNKLCNASASRGIETYAAEFNRLGHPNSSGWLTIWDSYFRSTSFRYSVIGRRCLILSCWREGWSVAEDGSQPVFARG